MNQYYLRFLLKRDGLVYRIPVLSALAALPVLSLALFGWQLYRVVDKLYIWQYSAAGVGSRVLTGKLADPIAAVLNQSGIHILFTIVLLTLTVGLMLLVFLTDTKDGRNIETMMRLPYSRLHYYAVRLALPAASAILLWLEMLATLLLCRMLYLHFIPPECLPPAAAESLWRSLLCQTWFPVLDPGQLTAALSTLLLLPSAMILTIFVDRGRSVLCLMGMLLSAAAIICFLYALPPAGLVVPAATAGSIFCGCYAVCHKRTF